MDRNNSIRILIWIQSTRRLHILFVWSKLSGSDHAQGECLLPPPSFCSTWSCHSTAFITPGASFSFSRFLLNLRQPSSWAETLKWKEDDVCGGSRRAGSALLCLYSSALRGMDRNLRKWRESGCEFSPKGLSMGVLERLVSAVNNQCPYRFLLPSSTTVPFPFQMPPDLKGADESTGCCVIEGPIWYKLGHQTLLLGKPNKDPEGKEASVGAGFLTSLVFCRVRTREPFLGSITATYESRDSKEAC